ncbi:MAG: tripartite tricarboxylate transporter substrate binding protein [Betaproteobacteria bacterium]|nr:tripartite tricarboxylate transporter substrate binding protein [Betaproteobacteria bacterium]
MRTIAGIMMFAAWLIVPPVGAQQYPVKGGRIIVTFPPGGAIDFMGRQLAQKFSESTGQPFIVENRAGGNQIIGTEHVMRSSPDGYTLLLSIDSTMTMNPFLYAKLPYDPLKDFAPISQLAVNQIVVLGNPSRLSGNGLIDFLANARADPGKYNFGAPGLVTRLIGEQLLTAAGVKMVHVPYAGSAALLPALLSGQVEMAVDGLSIYIPHIKEGKLRALAMATSKRQPRLPDVPALRELGHAQAEMDSWLGLFAPAMTPRPIVMRLNAEVAGALQDQQVRQRLLGNFQDPVTSTPEGLDALVKSDMAKWGPLIKSLGIKVD